MPADDIHEHRLDLFDGRPDLDRGRGRAVEVAWWLVKCAFFETNLPWPSRFKAMLLRAFGAQVGEGLCLRPRVNIHFPWKLTIGEHCWIGERCELLNLEQITLEAHVALGHDVYLAAASHDTSSRSMRYANQPIFIGRGTWVASRAFVGPGVTIGAGAVVGAGSVVVHDVGRGAFVAGNPARPIRPRVIRRP